MNETNFVKRWLAGGVTAVVLAGVVSWACLWTPESAQPLPQANAAQKAADLARVWPVFGGSIGRNMVNTVEKGLPAQWRVEQKAPNGKVLATPHNIRWVASLGSRAYGGPVISGGLIFVGTNNQGARNPRDKDKNGRPIDMGVVMCFRESNGQFVWQFVIRKLPSGQVNDWPFEGVCSTPVVDGNRVYFISNRCEVVCLDAQGFTDGKNDGIQDEEFKDKTDGDVIWRFDMMKDLNVFPHNMSACSPLIVGDTIFVVTANGVDEGHVNIPAPSAPSFIALDKKTGKLKWQDNSPGKMIMHGQWSNPTYAVGANGKGQIIFPGGDGWLYSFEPETGKPIWKFDANPKGTKYELGGRGTKSDFIATSVAIGDKVIIGTGQDPEHYEGVGHLWCIDINKKGDVSPDLLVDAKPTPPKTKANPNSAVIWHYGGPTTKEDQDKLQRDYYYGRTMSTVSVQDGLVYAGELAGYLHCLDYKTGKAHWVHDLKSAVWGSTYLVDNKVYIATEDGGVWVFAHSKDKQLLSQDEERNNAPGPINMNSPIRSTPIAVNGVLYIMSESHLYAIAQK